MIEKMEASKGTQEYKVGEIFLSSTSATAAQTMANATQILEALRKGGSFVGYARQYSEASTAAVGGDLGWVRPEQLPDPIAEAVRNLRPGQVSPPIALPGGVSIVAVQDTRKVLTADPRAAELNLKQISVNFPAGTTKVQAEPIVARFRRGLAKRRRVRRRRETGGRLQRRSRLVRRGQAEGSSRRVAGDDAADAGRPGNPPVRQP